jgi:hypothetical protein
MNPIVVMWLVASGRGGCFRVEIRCEINESPPGWCPEINWVGSVAIIFLTSDRSSVKLPKLHAKHPHSENLHYSNTQHSIHSTPNPTPIHSRQWQAV